jgi:hypothetical protein
MVKGLKMYFFLCFIMSQICEMMLLQLMVFFQKQHRIETLDVKKQNF